MTKQNSKSEEDKRRFSQEQYDMLKRCSEKKDMTEWNEWRKKNYDKDILLEGADLSQCYLKGGLLNRRILINNVTPCGEAHLARAKFIDAYLENTDLARSHLEEADFHRANLKNAVLTSSSLQSAIFFNARLTGANFRASVLDGGTSFWESEVDQYTDFRGVGMHSARIDAGTKQLLEYNIRRMNWEGWYKKQHRVLAWLVRKFWEISDYGISTKQIIKTFFQWALIFAAIYLAWGLIDYHLVGLKDDPGIVSNLFVLEGEQETISPWLVPFRSIYFSIVTMTTLGFGDMYANAHSFMRGLFGHALLSLQVILGYILLGALVTRFAVLFTAGGPAGKFADKKSTHPTEQDDRGQE